MIGSMFSLLMDSLPVFDMFITPLLSGVSAISRAAFARSAVTCSVLFHTLEL
jgi:hypothetical protein